MSKSRKVQLEKKIMIFLSSGVFIFSGLYASNVQAAPVFSSGSASDSTVAGVNNTASANSSSAFGYFNTAGGLASSAFGWSNTASAENASAFGYVNEASGWRPARSVSEIKRPMKMPALSVMAIMPAV